MAADEIPVASGKTPLEEAVEVMDRLAWHKRNLEHHLRLAEARAGEIREKIAYHEEALKGLAHVLKSEYGHAETSLPNGGRVRIQKARGFFRVSDDAAAMAFAKDRGFVRTKVVESLDRTSLRAALVEVGDALCDKTTGEVLAWAKIERPADGYSLSYELPPGR